MIERDSVTSARNLEKFDRLKASARASYALEADLIVFKAELFTVVGGW